MALLRCSQHIINQKNLWQLPKKKKKKKKKKKHSIIPAKKHDIVFLSTVKTHIDTFFYSSFSRKPVMMQLGFVHGCNQVL